MLEDRNTRIIIAICAIAWVILVARAIVNVKGPEDFVRTVPQSEIQPFAKAQRSAVQRRSFAENEEICAIIFEDSEGKLGTTDLVVGDKESCDIAYFDLPGMAPVASFHTHAGYDPEYDSEVPSLLDIRGDIQDGMDGYVSTPGGRFWHIDGLAGTATQVCGEGCLDTDPKFRACGPNAPARRYTLEQMERRFETQMEWC